MSLTAEHTSVRSVPIKQATAVPGNPACWSEQTKHTTIQGNPQPNDLMIRRAIFFHDSPLTAIYLANRAQKAIRESAARPPC